jgi:hypothetical protein
MSLHIESYNMSQVQVRRKSKWGLSVAVRDITPLLVLKVLTSQGIRPHWLTDLHLLLGRPESWLQGSASIGMAVKEGVTEVDEAGLIGVAVGVGVVTVILGVTTMITQHAALQQLAVVSEMASLVTPTASIGHLPIVHDPHLSDEPLALQYLCHGEPPGQTVLQDEGALDRPPQPLIPIGLHDVAQAMLVLIFERVSYSVETYQIVDGLLIFLL